MKASVANLLSSIEGSHCVQSDQWTAPLAYSPVQLGSGIVRLETGFLFNPENSSSVYRQGRMYEAATLILAVTLGSAD